VKAREVPTGRWDDSEEAPEEGFGLEHELRLPCAQWDAAHQMVSADVMRGPDEVATRQSYTYHYDALDRRVAKSDAFGTTHFAWDGDLMAMERRGGNEITYLYHPESFVPLAHVHDGVVHHLHTDHLGTPLEASNDAGELSWQMTYTTWGNTLVEEVAQIEQRVRFQGQYFDAETGLHYNQFRYYSPEVGRFVSNDPIGLLAIACGVPQPPQPAGKAKLHGHHIIFKGAFKTKPKNAAALAKPGDSGKVQHRSG